MTNSAIIERAKNLKKLDVTVKNVKFGPSRLSRETMNFVCDVVLDGKVVAHAYNDGHGAQTHVGANKQENYQTVLDIEAYYLSLDPTPYEATEDYPAGEFPSTLDWHIDMLVADIKQATEDKKRQTAFMNKTKKTFLEKVVIGDMEAFKNGTLQTFRTAKFAYRLEAILLSPSLVDKIKPEIKRLIGNLKEGESILNTNLSEIIKNL